MKSQKPIAVIMAVAMTAASLSAVSLYANDVSERSSNEIDYAVPLAAEPGDDTVVDNVGQNDVGVDNEGQDGAGAENEGQDGAGAENEGQDGAGAENENQDGAGAENENQDGAGAENENQDGAGEEEPEPTHFRDLSAGFVKGYIDMQDVPASIGGNSVKVFTENMKCVSVTGEDVSGNNNDLQIYLDIIVEDMKKIKNTQKAYALLFKFDKDSTITTTKGYTITTTDKNDGAQWKAEHASDDNYQYIVVWLNGAVRDNTIVFQEEKEVEGKKVKTLQTVKITREDTTPIDPSETTTPAETTVPETTTGDVELNDSILSVDKPVKTVIEEENGKDISDYDLTVARSNDIFLSNSKKFPDLSKAIKEGKAFSYDIKVKRNGSVRNNLTGDFYITMEIEGLKSAQTAYLYRYYSSNGTYSLFDTQDAKSGSLSFYTNTLGMTVIISTVDLESEAAETTAPSGSGTASPLITAVGNSALSGSEIQVYGDNVVLPNGTKLQIEAMDTAQSNNKAVELAISEGKAFAYDISLVKNDGTAISTNGIKALSVTIAVPDSLKGTSPLYVYRRERDDTFTNMNASLNNGKLSFVTQHLSTYIISSVALGSDIVNNDGSGTSTTTKKPNSGGNSGGNSGSGGGSVSMGGGSGSDKNENVNTGFLFALVPVGIAAAGIALTRKKKR